MVDDRFDQVTDAGLRSGVDQHRQQRHNEPPAVRPRIREQPPQRVTQSPIPDR
jgi:hypothetical protein